MSETRAGEPSFFRNDPGSDARLADLESRAAELERRLLAATTSANGQPAIRYAAPAGNHVAAGTPDDEVADSPAPGRVPDDEPAGRKASDDAPADAGQTDALASYRRPAARRPGRRGLVRHWRLVATGGTALIAGAVAVMVTTGSPAPGWPASVAVVQGQVKTACENPDVAAEPSGLNFACGKDTQQVLWVFSLLTSGNNPRFTDPATGREGLEPITRAQGGSIAWSLNLHHPYNAASPVDSLTVAARAINSIIAGATVTSASGGADVEPGLESSAANCERYTGSPALVTRAGYPAQCQAPLTTTGTASLVSDVFGQWMNGAPQSSRPTRASCSPTQTTPAARRSRRSSPASRPRAGNGTPAAGRRGRQPGTSAEYAGRRPRQEA